MYVMDYVSYIGQEWVDLLFGYIATGRICLGYEIGFRNVPHRQ